MTRYQRTWEHVRSGDRAIVYVESTDDGLWLWRCDMLGMVHTGFASADSAARDCRMAMECEGWMVGLTKSAEIETILPD